jgi:hypothetical protein
VLLLGQARTILAMVIERSAKGTDLHTALVDIVSVITLWMDKLQEQDASYPQRRD